MSEEELSEERKQLIAAIDWIDKERQRLKRLAESTIRKGGRGSGFRANLMKKESQWLFGQRTRVRERLVHVNSVIKDIRRTKSGRPGDSFLTVFFKVCNDNLELKMFEALLEMTRRRCPDEGPPSYGSSTQMSVLDALKGELEKIRAENGRPSRAVVRKTASHEKESQTDFGILVRDEEWKK